MITDSDFIKLPYTPDLAEGGAAYALRSLPYLYYRTQESAAAQLRHIATGFSIELAFRRHLGILGVPFDVKGAAPFTDPARYDVTLGGHRCDVQAFLISHKDQITQIRREPGVLLKAPALIPSDRHAGEGHGAHDLYLFAFLEALVASSAREAEKALKAGQPACMIICMPSAWVRPRGWNPIGPLVLKSDSDEPVTIELSGQGADRNPLTCRVELPPRTRVEIAEAFFSLSAVHSEGPVNVRIGIHSPALKETQLVQPHEWRNIWVYGMEILLPGYITRREFSEKAKQVLPGTRVFQYEQTRAKNLAVAVQELHPLEDLFERTKEWHRERQRG
jgi:hypothetical protein